ncbi:Nucleic acid-binding, OB-fold [Sesbania bispinosa]|nr:Nucleic acid-binding, OB-fold [Sesbania bispinosa]
MALVSVGFHKVSDLGGRRENRRLRMKLIRVWKMSAVATTSNDPFALHMLIKSDSVIEGEVYNLSNFSVTRNSGKFRATHHDYKLTFNANKYKDSSLSQRRHSGHWFESDFIGIVTGISEELNLSKEDRQTRLILIDMVDEMGKIRCAIFGHLIDTVKGHLTLPRCGLPVLITQLARVNLYRGEVGIQNLMNASELLWNPDIPEAVEFKNGLAVHEIETDVAISLISDNARPISIREQFLKMYPRRRVGELNHLLEDGTYIVHGTITEVFQEDDWWYIACSCMRAVDFDQGFPYCVVSDETESSELIMFDAECYSLINIPCKGKQCGGYPNEILDFIGQELLFRVELNGDESSTYDDESIKVRKICYDPSIIKEFKELIDDETPLKLKFAPAFSKFEQSGGKTCVINLTPNNAPISSEYEVTPGCSAQSSSTPSNSSINTKPPVEEKNDEPCEKKKRGKSRAIKVEKSG